MNLKQFITLCEEILEKGTPRNDVLFSNKKDDIRCKIMEKYPQSIDISGFFQC